MCAFILITISVFYTGGIGCFMAPRDCKISNSDIIYPTNFPLAVSQSTRIATRVASNSTSTPTASPSPSPTPTEIPVSTLLDSVIRVEEQNLNCGKDPYDFNGMSNRWQRKFSSWCYNYTGHDPFEVIFWGMNYGEVTELLTSAQLLGLSHDEQVSRLVEMKLWDYSCQCVPQVN